MGKQEVLNIMTKFDRPLTAAEISARSGSGLSATRRILNSLRKEGDLDLNIAYWPDNGHRVFFWRKKANKKENER